MDSHNTVSALQRLKGEETQGQFVEDPEASEGHTPSSCQVIGFVGAKGGVGTTTVALNVAMAFIHAGQKVIYVELNTHGGTASWLLQLSQTAALGHSSLRPEDINQNFVAQLLMQHSTGLNVLSLSPWSHEKDSIISPDVFSAVLQELQGLADYVVLDFPLEPSAASLLFLNHCHILDLVLDTDTLCLTLAKNQIEFIHSQGTIPILLTPVNRSGIPPTDGLQGIQDLIGHEAPVLIPAATELCHTASIKRLPIVCINPNSVPALQMVKLSERFLKYFQEDGTEVAKNRRAQDRRKTDRRDRGGW